MPDAVSWHGQRRRAILRDHPRVRELFGNDPTTGVWVLALVVAQFAMAIEATRLPLWAWFALALTAGALVAHALGVLIHEATHNLVFRRSPANKALAIVANLPLGAPAAIAFRRQHLLHHRYLGDTDDRDGRDTQAPTGPEARFVRGSGVRKLLSFAFGRFFYKARPANAVPLDVWLVVNIATSILADLTVLAVDGFRPLAFLVLSSLLAFGPHPLGGRRVAEHLTLRRGQPTNSCYGFLNRLCFDVGYHVEHHDLPAVPWRRMRRLRAMAREHYDGLAYVPSWSFLMFAYFVDRRFQVEQYTGASSVFLLGEGRLDEQEAAGAGPGSRAGLRRSSALLHWLQTRAIRDGKATAAASAGVRDSPD
ncbi:MAG: fatty acid desaturase [Myxococcales bacterium]|nr:fatty acid desaturase [Myxococcales bacterium]